MPPLSENPDLKGVLPADFVHGYASASYQIEGEYGSLASHSRSLYQAPSLFSSSSAPKSPRSPDILVVICSHRIPFLFGSTGGHDADGRGPSVWDVALRAQNLETGDEAVNSYHLWREDVRLLKEYGCNAYRFSVSWSRVKPLGGKDDPVNEKGIGYYNDLVSNPLLSCSFISAFCVLPSFSFPLNSYYPPLVIPACLLVIRSTPSSKQTSPPI
jgi:hypothetical protein